MAMPRFQFTNMIVKERTEVGWKKTNRASAFAGKLAGTPTQVLLVLTVQRRMRDLLLNFSLGAHTLVKIKWLTSTSINSASHGRVW